MLIYVPKINTMLLPRVRAMQAASTLCKTNSIPGAGVGSQCYFSNSRIFDLAVADGNAGFWQHRPVDSALVYGDQEMSFFVPSLVNRKKKSLENF